MNRKNEKNFQSVQILTLVFRMNVQSEFLMTMCKTNKQIVRFRRKIITRPVRSLDLDTRQIKIQLDDPLDHHRFPSRCCTDCLRKENEEK